MLEDRRCGRRVSKVSDAGKVGRRWREAGGGGGGERGLIFPFSSSYQRREPLTKSHRATGRVRYLLEGSILSHGSGLSNSHQQPIS